MTLPGVGIKMFPPALNCYSNLSIKTYLTLTQAGYLICGAQCKRKMCVGGGITGKCAFKVINRKSFPLLMISLSICGGGCYLLFNAWLPLGCLQGTLEVNTDPHQALGHPHLETW